MYFTSLISFTRSCFHVLSLVIPIPHNSSNAGSDKTLYPPAHVFMGTDCSIKDVQKIGSMTQSYDLSEIPGKHCKELRH